MCATPSAALAQLREAMSRGDIARLAEARQMRLLVVFGSVLEESREPVDLDLAYLADEWVDQVDLLHELFLLTGFERIDLMDLSRAGIVARARALGNGVALFEAEPHLFVEQQMLAIARRADTQWPRDLELDVLAGP